MKEAQKEIMKKFLSKFQPRKPIDVRKQAEEEQEKLIERKKDAFTKYSQISANNGKPGFSKPL
jgi:tubulin--tyrosine ligase